MAVNYGITYCKKVLKDLRDFEDKMFEEKGHGFVQFGEQHNTELKYKRLLKQFERERELDLKPTYDPDIHGSEHQ
ncbi:hypothetical protein HJ090_24020 [Vibrio parahaemolyticus]|uniref:hypothetical protein n=1 Tax=Vibrio parahaemolyticus TaxID=670 RepID=UPI0021119F93|nr:hypothetical protein [Vibrio parahaemolyticus]MBE4205034.1 hypothetical protein [Vibrio parahaemolyticus]